MGCGTGGKNFHAPYVEAADDCELVGIVARAPATIAQARADWPETPIFGSLGEMIDSGLDAVTISTPPATRRKLVFEAVGRGIHVVADKPFAPSAAAARETPGSTPTTPPRWSRGGGRVAS
jgi:predicted dehydrogenase